MKTWQQTVYVHFTGLAITPGEMKDTRLAITPGEMKDTRLAITAGKMKEWP